MAADLQGDIFREKEGRRTLRFTHGGQSYFLKYHAGVGWQEVIKNLVQLRAPVVSARNEYEAARRLSEVGLDTLVPVAFGERGINPAHIESFLITEDLDGSVSLEDYCRDWKSQPPQMNQKRQLVRVVMRIARIMHRSGINHRDFYLCHFLLYPETLGGADDAVRCHLIDLHRAQCRKRVPRRWMIKDIAGLAYSAMDIGLSRRDWLRCVRHYTGGSLSRTLRDDKAFWCAVKRRAEALYRKDMGREPPEWL
ncbi:lipopolysaccharide core heptose(I) kinase RfaP [Alcanivorax quisquiliarum]|uniref:Lipopolysaccharide core heptose(I) kinase RfaP n=1 Tax=Alcanivorax quisquiliarum TaxID=2933565 RepID=A0ABT0EA95_9GAMM|nr:lipopolysaccharide core heptose(I) kinase RfaP [Alcanivorax quisquiliarum]MCK0538746.1 lipopolysaccharide core heptose(I) kinase RfaP [Alcanivorax quisquiliarum]